VVRKSSERGSANHGWLNSYHTFSFSSYYDPKFANFHSLRVINEDRVSPSEGFGTHGHSNAEIFSYVVSGALSHRDSIGNKEILKRGEVQFTSAGTGISHSEFNGSDTDYVHFLQIWVRPRANGLKPNYQTRNFSDSEKHGKLRLIVSPDGQEKSVQINNDIKVYASILKPGEQVQHTVAAGRDAYVHVVQDATSFDSEANLAGLTVNGTLLAGGDGAFLRTPTANGGGDGSLTLVGSSKAGGKPVEFLLFDVKKA